MYSINNYLFLAHLMASFISLFFMLFFLNCPSISLVKDLKSSFTFGMSTLLNNTPSRTGKATNLSPGLNLAISLMSCGTTNCPLPDIFTNSISVPVIFITCSTVKQFNYINVLLISSLSDIILYTSQKQALRGYSLIQ